jgi:hypothetical protein
MSENFIHTALDHGVLRVMISDMEKQGYEVVKVNNGYVCHELGTNGLILVMQAKRQKDGVYFIKFNSAFLNTGMLQSAMVH